MTQKLTKRAKVPTKSRHKNLIVWLSAALFSVSLAPQFARAEDPPPPCHANPSAAADDNFPGHILAAFFAVEFAVIGERACLIELVLELVSLFEHIGFE